MLTEKDYCDYETCVALKELGFRDSTDSYYKDDGKYVSIHAYWRPELTQRWSLYETQKWLREEKKIEVLVLSKGMVGAPYYFQVYTEDEIDADFKEYDSYEEALSEGIKEAVKLLKEK